MRCLREVKKKSLCPEVLSVYESDETIGKLKVYYSKVSADGKALRPSYLIQELLRLYPDVKVRDEDEKELVQKELTEKQG